MAASSFGSKNQPHFAENDTPDVAGNPTQVADYAANVGNRKTGLSTDRTALTGADLWDGLAFFETDTGLTYVHTGGSWVLGSIVVKFVDTTTTTGLGQPIQSGIFKVKGSGGATMSAPITFPRAFTATPIVVANMMGYKATGVFDPSGLSFAAETVTAQQVTTSAAQFYLRSPATLSTTSDYYVSWIAVGS